MILLLGTAAYLAGRRSGLGLVTPPANIGAMLADASARYGVPLDLLTAVARRESGFNPAARSSAGAMGVMQLMPATAAGLGVSNPWDAAQSIDGGARLLADLLRKYNGNMALALAAYNAGPGAVAKYGGVPPYAETQQYVTRIMGDVSAVPFTPYGPPTPAASTSSAAGTVWAEIFDGGASFLENVFPDDFEVSGPAGSASLSGAAKLGLGLGLLGLVLVASGR